MMKKTLLTLVCTFVALCASTQNTFQLKTSGTDPQLLVVQYSGEDKPEKGKKFLFNISVNGTLLYTEGLNRNRHGLFEIVYPIPDSVLQGKSSALVRFEAYDETASVGKIYDVSIVRQKLETGIFTDRKNWQGLAKDWTCSSDGTFIYTEPDGPQHPYVNQSVIDLMSYYALEVNLKLTGVGNIPVEVFASAKNLKAGTDLDKENIYDTRRARFTLQRQKNGECRLLIPFSVFDTPKASQSTIRRIKSIAFRLSGEGGGKVKVLSTRLLEGNSVKTTADCYSRPGEPGDTIIYPVTVTNCEPTSQFVYFSIQKYGWEAFPATVEPAQLELASGETRKVNVYVIVPPGIPAGGREKQTLQILPSANPAAVRTLTFTTLRSMPHPFTIHTVEGWDEVRRKAENYDWAKDRKERYIQDAKAWIVPLRPPYVANGDGIPYLCATTHEHGLMNNAIAWQLTRSPEYARKVKQFLLMISDYQNGFPLTRKASHQSSVQEGSLA